VTVSESAEGTLFVTAAIDNYTALPANSWFNIWFDLDEDQDTGDAGDEALVRYLSSGEMQFYLWDGSALVKGSTAGMSGQFEAGVLTLSAPRSTFGSISSFGILAVSARGQQLGEDELIASDYAPDRGRSAYVGPVQMAFPDPARDHDAAPDITAIKVSDTKDGWISFGITTPNYVALPAESVLVLSIDSDSRESTGNDGSEILITSIGGEPLLERWDARTQSWRSDDAPPRVRTRNAGSVVTIEVHRSELDDVPRFGFAVIAADINTLADSVLGVDLAPDDLAFYRYTLANKAALRLTAARLVGTPARPRAGKPFAITMAVIRSDTSRGITAGTVVCRVLVDGKRVQAKGSVAGGSGRCALVVPRTAKGTVLRGTITVRSGGQSVAASFSYVVR